mgnify:CR=1 FL=1
MPDYKSPGTFAGDVKFGDAAADAHQFTGSVYISGAVYATQHIVDSVTTTVTNLYQQGSTKLGDTADDIHEVTGSFYLSGTFADPNTTGQMFEVRGGMGEEGNPTAAHTPILTVSGTSDGSVTWPIVSVNTTAAGADRSTFRVKAAAANNAVVSVFAVDDGKLFRVMADPDNDCSLQLYNTSNVVKTLIHTNGDTYFNGGDVIFGGTSPTALLSATGTVGFVLPVAQAEGLKISDETGAYMTVSTVGAQNRYTQFNKPVNMVDDTPIYFGTGFDINMQYDEDGTDTLMVDGTGGMTLADDFKLYFGTGLDASIEYDEDGTDELIISGAAGGVDIKLTVASSDALTISDETGAYMTVSTVGDQNRFVQFNKSINIIDDTSIYFGSDFDTQIEYDEDGTDTLLVGGTAAGMTISDDFYLYFGTDLDAKIYYDENSSDELIISGAAGGIDIQAPTSVADALILRDETGSHTLTFDTRGTSNTPFLFTANGGSAYVAQFFNDGDDPARYGIKIQGGGDAGGGTTYYVNCFDGDGGNVGYLANISTTFAVTDPSDKRIKDNIRNTAITGLETINNIKVRDFEMKKNGLSKTGFVAQELQKAYAPAVTVAPGPDEMMGVAYSVLVPVLVKATQGLHAKIKKLESKLKK